MKKNTLLEIITALLVILFGVYAAASKLLDYETFKVQMGKSPLYSILN